MQKISTGLYSFKNELLIMSGGTDEVGIGWSSLEPLKIGNFEISCWGEGNLYPQEFLRKLRLTGAALGGLDVLVSAHYGQGFRLFKDVRGEAGLTTEEIAIHELPEIARFFRNVGWENFIASVISDYETFRISFIEYVLNFDYTKIVSVKRHSAANCRFSIPNKKSGFPDWVFISSDWEKVDDKKIVKMPYLPTDLPTEQAIEYCKNRGVKSFISSVSECLQMEKLYPHVDWHSSFENGWVDVVLSVPVFKKYMFENQLNVKYVVYIADDYFSHLYGRERWQDFSSEDKEKLREELVNKIDKTMSGNHASGRSMIAPYFRDAENKLIKGIEIIPIDDKIKDGNFLPDATAGNSEILFPMGVDPCLLGAGIPGGTAAGRSGSDKREAYTILCTRMPVRRLHTLSIFERIKEWNNWPTEIYGAFPNINLTTLDKNPNGQQLIVN